MSNVKDGLLLIGTFIIRKYKDKQHFLNDNFFEKSEFQNAVLTEGKAAVANLLIGAAETAFNNANAYIGVGDDTTAFSAAHTGLQASTNKAYVGMESGYPQYSAGAITFQAVFDGDTANFSWQEFTVASGNSDAAVNLNRAVSDQGTKVSGQIYTINLILTIS